MPPSIDAVGPPVAHYIRLVLGMKTISCWTPAPNHRIFWAPIVLKPRSRALESAIITRNLREIEINWKLLQLRANRWGYLATRHGQELFGFVVEAGVVSRQSVVVGRGVASLLGAWRGGDSLWELLEGWWRGQQRDPQNLMFPWRSRRSGEGSYGWEGRRGLIAPVVLRVRKTIGGPSAYQTGPQWAFPYWETLLPTSKQFISPVIKPPPRSISTLFLSHPQQSSSRLNFFTLLLLISCFVLRLLIFLLELGDAPLCGVILFLPKLSLLNPSLVQLLFSFAILFVSNILPSLASFYPSFFFSHPSLSFLSSQGCSSISP